MGKNWISVKKRNGKRSFYRKKKRAYKKKRTANGFNTMATIGKFVAPSMMVRLKYVTQINIDPGAVGTPGNYYFRMNSLFDPDYSSVGRQPYGYDQIVNLGYTKYIVLGSKINIKSIMPNDGQLNPNKYNQTIVSSTIKTSPSTTLQNVSSLLENGESRYHTCNINSMRSHSNFFSAKKFFGVTNVKDNEGLGGSVNGNPEDVAYARVSAMPMEASIDAYRVSCLVTIDYIAYFHDRQTIVGS